MSLKVSQWVSSRFWGIILSLWQQWYPVCVNVFFPPDLGSLATLGSEFRSRLGSGQRLTSAMESCSENCLIPKVPSFSQFASFAQLNVKNKSRLFISLMSNFCLYKTILNVFDWHSVADLSKDSLITKQCSGTSFWGAWTKKSKFDQKIPNYLKPAKIRLTVL